MSASPYFTSREPGYIALRTMNWETSLPVGIGCAGSFSQCPLWKGDGRPWQRKTKHLCRNLCFYKGYAPARKWYKLVACVEERGLDAAAMLEGWSARLIEEVCLVDSDDEIEGGGGCGDDDGDGVEKKKRKEVVDGKGKDKAAASMPLANPPPKPFSVYFYAPNGETFRTVRAVCQALAMEDGEEGRGGGMKRFPRAVIEAEIKKSTSWADIDPRSGSNKRVKMLPSSPHTAAYTSKPSSISPAKTLWPGTTFIFSPSRESPFGLLEELTWSDPWRLLLTCILLNRTTRRQVDPVLSELLDKYESCSALLKNASQVSLAVIVR